MGSVHIVRAVKGVRVRLHAFAVDWWKQATGTRRLVRHLRVVPHGTVLLLAVILFFGALSGPVLSVATGWLVGRIALVAVGGDQQLVVAPLLALAGVLVYQLSSESFIGAARLRAALAVDGAVRQRVRRAMGAPEGVEHLEDQVYRDLAFLPTSGMNSIGNALAAWLIVQSASLGALLSAVIVISAVPVAGVVSLVVLMLARAYSRRMYASMLEGASALWAPNFRAAGYWRQLTTTATGAKEIRLYGFAATAVQRYAENMAVVTDNSARTQRRVARKAWPLWVANGLAIGLPAWFVAQQALSGALSPGRVATILSAVVGMQMISGAGREMNLVSLTLPSVDALEELERRSTTRLRPVVRSVSADRGPLTIRFEDVSFSYPGSDRAIFEHLDLTLVPGQSVAIVGENGAGKTTLIKLLARFYEPTAGRIVADGVDIAELPVREWRARLAVILQDFNQFQISARRNIALADWDHPDRDRMVDRAIDAAGARELVERLPSGLDTILNRGFSDGADLSGGQWQRLALARALYASDLGAQVLVLDEPTAHLDVRAEVALFDRLLTHSAGKTAVVVSHRYSTVRRAQRIVVLGEGGILEDGSHEDLLALGGTYAGLYALQAAAFTEEVA